MIVKRIFITLIIFLVIYLSLSLTALIFLTYSGYQDLQETQLKFSSGKITEGMSLSQNASRKFLIAQKTWQVLNPAIFIVSQRPSAELTSNFLDSAAHISQAASLLGESTLMLGDILTSITQGQEYQKNDLVKVSIYLADAKNSLALAQSQTALIKKDQGNNIFLKNYNIDTINDELNKTIWTVDVARNLVDGLPSIVATDAEKTYLVLLQNNMELRPTGGFIGSFATIKFTKGYLADFRLLDVYDADGQLKGHVEPPMPIRKYLPQVNWYLRDSNWETDFQKSAKTAAWFLEKETGVKVDGVLAIDVSLAQLILQEIGEVTLPDYQEVINAQNLFTKTQKFTQENFFEGSAQKKNFLGALSRAMIDKISQSGKNNLFLVLPALGRGLEEKHLLVAFFDPTIQAIFTVNGWGGTLTSPKPKENTINDFLGVREANLGVNKANFLIKRSMEQTVNIADDGTIKGTLAITYDHTSARPQNDSWIYKNYLRIFFPPKTSVTKLTFDEKEVETIAAEPNPVVYEKKGFWQKLGDKTEIEQKEEDDLSMIGFLMEISPGSKKTVAISYQLAEQVPPDRASFEYILSLSKQPGTEVDPYVLKVNYPSSLRAKSTDSSAIVQANTLTIPSDLAKDREFGIEFLRKE